AANLLADAVDAVGDEVAGGPIAAAAADAVEEVLDDLLALGRVHDLRVELEGDDLARVVAHRGNRRVLGVGKRAEAWRHLDDAVAMRHPYRQRRIDAGEDWRLVFVLLDVGMAVLALVGRRDLAAELMGEQLHAVADAEDGQLLLEHP